MVYYYADDNLFPEFIHSYFRNVNTTKVVRERMKKAADIIAILIKFYNRK